MPLSWDIAVVVTFCVVNNNDKESHLLTNRWNNAS